MRITIPVTAIVTFFLTVLFIRLIKPDHSPHTFAVFASQNFINGLKNNSLQEIKSVTGINKEGKEVTLALDFSDDTTQNENIGFLSNLRVKTYQILSHSTTCVKRSDLEPNEPIATCTAGGWYTASGQSWSHCHCYVPWGNP
ncbi:MAG: hypothetical protein JSR71_05395 [Proteobacteria bacterium]|nr:hypothetical protein [Pseudomonadota bacterium]